MYKNAKQNITAVNNSRYFTTCAIASNNIDATRQEYQEVFILLVLRQIKYIDTNPNLYRSLIYVNIIQQFSYF